MQSKIINTKQRGFTIVELLVVIVVIAILAAISVVAYTGIQDRANDTTIQNDLNSFAKKIHLVAAETGGFPAAGATRSGGSSTGNSTSFSNFSFNPSRGAYMTTVDNLYYCTGVEAVSGQNIFRVAARSKSGNTFQYSSNRGIENQGNVAVGIGGSGVCSGMSDPHTWAYGWYSGGGAGAARWWSWIE